MKRIRLIVTAIVLSACADDAPARLTVVAIAATPCDRPTARLGAGTVVDEGLVLTAAHLVEDDLRGVEVSGRPAGVVMIDTRIDAAILVLESPIDDGAASLSDSDVPDAVRIVTPTDVIDTTVERVVTLDVDDTTDRVVHRRRALVLAGAVPGGTSGAPVVDGDGRVVAMVNVTHAGRDETYATRAGELRSLIDSVIDSGLDTRTRSSLAAADPCA